METIWVGFSRPQGWFEPFSWIIRLFDWSPFSHTYLRINIPEYNRQVIFQSSGLLVNFESPSIFSSAEYVYKEFPISISDATKQNIMQFCLDRVGLPYDLKGVFGLAIVKFMALFGKKINNPFGSGDTTYFCSKVLDEILKDYTDIPVPLDIDKATPTDVFNSLNAYFK